MEEAISLLKQNTLPGITLILVIYMQFSMNRGFTDIRIEMNQGFTEIRAEMNEGDYIIRAEISEVKERVTRVETLLEVGAAVGHTGSERQ